MPSFDCIVLLMLAFLGLLMVILKKPLFIGTEKYTEESLARYARPAGYSTILMGLSGSAFLYTLRLLGDDKINGWVVLICLAGAVIGIIANIVFIKKILVKK